MERMNQPMEPRDTPVMHLLGVGKVGQALLQRLSARHPRLVAATDRSGTVYDDIGLTVASLLECKQRGMGLTSLPGGEAIELDSLWSSFTPDVVVDCAATDLEHIETAWQRSLIVLRSGARMVWAAKGALLAGARVLFDHEFRSRIGCNAVLGGTGAAFVEELPQLRSAARQIVAVPNATTTTWIRVVERGGSPEQALGVARERGLLESDPTQDLDGRDAALKLVIVANALFRTAFTLDDVALPRADDLDPEVLQDRFQHDQTTRLVCRASRQRLQVVYETLPRESTLANDDGTVVYGYLDDRGRRRVHVGHGVGPEGTANALIVDLERLFRQEGRDGE